MKIGVKSTAVIQWKDNRVVEGEREGRIKSKEGRCTPPSSSGMRILLHKLYPSFPLKPPALPNFLSLSLSLSSFCSYTAEMAAWGSMKNIFENPMPDSRCPWGQLLPLASPASFEMFGELCHPSPSSSSPSPNLSNRPCIDAMPPDPGDSSTLEIFGELCYTEKYSDSTAAISAGARFEEGKVEYLRSRSAQERSADKRDALYKRSHSDVRQRVISPGGRCVQSFPPPITTIGSCGKPRVYFKSFRKNGRFVLKEVRIPTQRLLHATRHDGRLTMRVLRPEDEERRNREGREEADDSQNGSETLPV